MRHEMKSVAAGLALAAALSATSGRADDFSDQGRTIFQKNQHAVVTVMTVLKSKFTVAGKEGQSSESRDEVTGTIVAPSGLTVLSLSRFDPGQLMQKMAGEGEQRFKMESELTDVELLLDDGTEVPAEVVLRDKDLDLAFIRPKAKLAKPMAALDLGESGKADVLDEVIALNRLGNAAGRAYSASVERISAVIRKPRLFYIPDSNTTNTTLGSPAFTLDGHALGIFVLRALKDRSGGSFPRMQGGNLTPVILPAEDIVKAVKQVPAAGQ
jgi:S1-C subfamily serine protease